MVIALTLGILLGTALAQEVDVERAKTLYSNGKMLFEEKEYDKAIEAWTLAWQLSGKKQAILLYNIALAYEEMDNYTEAIDYLYQYRMYAPAEEQEVLKEKINELKQSQAEREQALQAQPVESPVPEPVVVEAPTPEVTEVEPSAQSELSMSDLPVVSAVPMIAAWSGTAALAATSIGLRANYNGRIDDLGCTYVYLNAEESVGTYECSQSMDSAESSSLNRQAMGYNVGLVLTMASTGAAGWLTYRYVRDSRSSVSIISISPTGVAVGGSF